AGGPKRNWEADRGGAGAAPPDAIRRPVSPRPRAPAEPGAKGGHESEERGRSRPVEEDVVDAPLTSRGEQLTELINGSGEHAEEEGNPAAPGGAPPQDGKHT